jgi:hypothetical protein
MVVIAIIGVLAALVAAAVTKVIPAQQQRNTERTIRKLNGELQAHWRAVIEDAQAEVKQNKHFTVLPLAGGDPERAKVLWIKLRLVQQFPMSYQELLLPGTLGTQTYIGADPTYAKKLAAVGVTSASALTYPLTQDGEKQLATCLHIALTAKGHRGRTTQDDSFNSDERGTYTLPNGNSLPMLVDNWGQPLVFFRWPASDPTFQSMKPTTAGAFADPLDSTGRLTDPSWNNNNSVANAANISNVESLIKHPIHTLSGTNWITVNTAPPPPYGPPYYLFPVVVSAGVDGVLGLDYFMAPGAGSEDNIYSYLLK